MLYHRTINVINLGFINENRGKNKKYEQSKELGLFLDEEVEDLGLGLVELYLSLLEGLLVLQVAGNIVVLALADYFQAELVDDEHHLYVFP